MQVDSQVKGQELSLKQQYNEQLMSLQQQAAQQKAALEQQAMQLSLEYQQKVTQEEMMKKQYEMQKEQAEMQQKMQNDVMAVLNKEKAVADPAAPSPTPAHQVVSSYVPPVVMQPAAYAQQPRQLSYVPPVAAVAAPAYATPVIR